MGQPDKDVKNMTKILITENYCSSNRGDAAILTSMIGALKVYVPDAEFTVLSYYPKVAKIMHKVDSFEPVVVTTGGYIKIMLAVLKMIHYLIWALMLRYGLNSRLFISIEKLETLEKYTEADIITSVGGAYYNDNYKPAIFGRLYSIFLSKVIKKPVVLYAHSIGPFNTLVFRHLAKYVLNKVDLITLRDTESKKVLDELRVLKPPIYVTADSAFNLSVINADIAKELLLREGINVNDRPLVSMSVRRWGFYDTVDASVGHRSYLQVMARSADYLVKAINATIVFISTCTDFGGYDNDDRIVAREVISMMMCANAAKIVEGEYSPEELKGMLGQMDMHIGTRMHSNIFALSMGVPVVAVAYEFKTTGLMRFFDLEKYVCNIENITFEDLRAKLEAVWANKQSITQKIKSNIITLQKKSMKNAELTHNVLNY